MKVSASSLRQTNELHNGCAPGRSRPTSSHLATDRDAAPPPGRRRSSDGQTDDAAASHASDRVGASSTASATSTTAACSATCDQHRQQPAASPGRAGHAEPGRRVRRCARRRPPRRVRRSRAGGLPSQDAPAFAVLRRGRGRQHRDQRPLGHLAARCGHAGVADEGPLPDLHPLDPQPAAAQLVPADQGVVGQERVGRSPSSGTGSSARSTPPRPCRSGRRAGAARSASAGRSRGGTATCGPRRAPGSSPTTCRADPAPHGVGPRPHARPPSSRTTPSTSSTSTSQADHGRRHQPGQQADRQVGRRPRGRRHRPRRGPVRRRPRSAASRKRATAAPRSRRTPRPRRRVLAGRSDHGPRADPRTCRAGAPDQNSPSGTVPNTAEPGATSASSSTELPGHSMLRAPIRAPLADPHLADPQHVAVDPVAG